MDTKLFSSCALYNLRELSIRESNWRWKRSYNTKLWELYFIKSW